MKKVLGITLLFAAIAVLSGCNTNAPTQSSESSSSSVASSATNDSSTQNSTVDSGKELAMEDMESVVVSYDAESTTLIVARKGNGNDVYRLFLDSEKFVTASGEEASVDMLTEGTVVVVTFNGIIGYSYPAYIPNYTKVEVTENQDMDTAASAKEALGGMASMDETTETTE